MSINPPYQPPNVIPKWIEYIGAIALCSGVVLALFHSLILAALIAFVCVSILIPFGAPLILGFFWLLLGLNIIASETTILLFGFRFYGSDLIIVFFGAFVGQLIWRTLMFAEKPPARAHEEYAVLVFSVIATAYGLFAAAWGMAYSHFSFNDAMGDYRLQYVYPLALVLPLVFNIKRSHLAMIKYILVTSIFTVLAIGANRFSTGISWQHDVYTEVVYDPRFFSGTEALTLEIAVAYCACVLSSRVGGIRRLLAIMIIGVCTIALFVSGWRLAMALAVLSPILAMFVLSWTRSQPIAGALKSLLLSGAAVGISLLVTLYLLSNFSAYEAQWLRLKERVAAYDSSIDIRTFAWKAAIDEFQKSPLVGSGLGLQLAYFKRGSDGTFIAMMTSTHNYFLDLLSKTGILGLALLGAVHGYFNLSFYRHCRSVEERHRPVMAALYVGYICSMIVHSLEPFFAGGVTALYLIMGFIMRILRERPDFQPLEAANNGLCSTLAEESS